MTFSCSTLSERPLRRHRAAVAASCPKPWIMNTHSGWIRSVTCARMRPAPTDRGHLDHRLVLDAQPLRLSAVDPQHVLREELVQVGVVLRGDVGVQRQPTDYQAVLPGRRPRNGLVGRERIEARPLQQGGLELDLAGWGLQLEAILAVPEDLVLAVGDEALGLQVLHAEPGPLQLPADQVLDVCIGEEGADAEALPELLEDHGRVTGVVARGDRLLAEEELRLEIRWPAARNPSVPGRWIRAG